MKTLSSFALGTLLLSVVVLAGCDSGSDAVQSQVSQLSKQVQALQTQLEDANTAIAGLQLQQGGAQDSGGAAIRIGFVTAEEVFVRYSGTEAAIAEYNAEKEDKENQLEELQDSYNAGAIDASTYQERQNRLVNELATLDQQLTNDITQKIVEAVEALGQDLDFDLITSRKNVVLYYRDNGIVEDLTEQVLEYMNNNAGGAE